MGLVGGLVPSPSALLLLLAATALGRAWFGFEADAGRLGHEDTIFDIPTEGPPYLCLDATVAHVTAIGARDVSPVEDIGSLRFVTFRDPDGNTLMAAQVS